MKNLSAKFYFLIILCPFLIFNNAFAVEEERLELLDTFKKIPSTSIYTFKKSFSKEAIPGWAAIVGSSLVLYHYDEQILLHSQKKGRDWGLGNQDNTRGVVNFGGQELLRLPSDTASALYFLGDGWMHLGIAGSVLGYGYAKNQTYEVNTGIILIHGMFVSTIFNQTIKLSNGHLGEKVLMLELLSVAHGNLSQVLMNIIHVQVVMMPCLVVMS